VKTQAKEQLKKTVDKIKIHKRGTKEGDAQREAFRKRWGIRPEGFDFGSVHLVEED
jgi:hypothetical protein